MEPNITKNRLGRSIPAWGRIILVGVGELDRRSSIVDVGVGVGVLVEFGTGVLVGVGVGVLVTTGA
jgi:hypothetical protein